MILQAGREAWHPQPCERETINRHPASFTSDKRQQLPGFRHRSSLRKISLDISRRLQFALPSAKLANKVKGRAN
jgi:hypothetical protein